MDIEHTKEPWKFEGLMIIDSTGKYICQPTFNTDGTQVANANRIVACVNACAEIENKELEAVSYAQLLESHQFLQRQVASAEVLVEALRKVDKHLDAMKCNEENIEIGLALGLVIDKALATYDKLSETNTEVGE